MNNKKKQVHFTFPTTIINELEQFVDYRKRSEFVALATKKELEKLKLLKAIENSGGAWTDIEHPELKDEEHIASFVRNLRRESEERVYYNIK
jgi:metal-responsive CopG/Arc/MetJ family transcriptional regulator